MAQSRNLFALLDTEEEDAFSIVGVKSAAAVKAGKVQENNKKSQKTKSPVYNPMMMTTKSNRDVLPDHVSRRQPVITKEEPERERIVRDYRKNSTETENQHAVVNGNGNGNGNSNNVVRNNYGGFQGNSRRNLDSRAPNQYRNHRNSSNDLQGTNVGGANLEKTENLVDAEGWQKFHGRRGKTEIGADNQSQNGGEFYGYGGDRRWRRSDRGNQVYNNGREEENSGVCENEVENGEIVSFNGVESNVNEGEKDSTEYKDDGAEAQKKKQDDDEKVTKKKEEDVIQFTLQEYEEMLLEKRKAIEFENQAEQRKVVLDKDFESMLLVEKKSNEDELAPKQNSGVAKKKENNIKGDKIGKVWTANASSYRAEFLRRRNERSKRYEEKLNDNNGEEPKKNDKNGEETKKNKKNGEEPKKHNIHVNGSPAADLAPIIIDAKQFPTIGEVPFPKSKRDRSTRV